MFWQNHEDSIYYVDSIARINYAFTTAMLVFTLLLSVVFCYIVLTQSKKLGTYKWFLLNHTFWCLLFEIAISITKPAFLSPLLSGFVLGPMGNVCTLKSTIIFIFLDISLGIMGVGGLIVSLLYRYSAIVPGLMKTLLSSKYSMMLYALLHVLAVAILMYYSVGYLGIDREVFVQNALEYDARLGDFINETSFIFIKPDTVKYPLMSLIVILILASLLLIAVILNLMYKVKKMAKNSMALDAKHQHAIALSLFVQVSMTILFQFVPVTCILGVWSFQIPNTFAVVMIMICILSMHASIEMVSVMYFVLPYRKFIIYKLYGALRIQQNPSNVTFIYGTPSSVGISKRKSTI